MQDGFEKDGAMGAIGALDKDLNGEVELDAYGKPVPKKEKTGPKSSLDELADGSDPAPRQLGQQDHPLDPVVLQQSHVRPHLRDRFHLPNTTIPHSLLTIPNNKENAEFQWDHRRVSTASKLIAPDRITRVSREDEPLFKSPQPCSIGLLAWPANPVKCESNP